MTTNAPIERWRPAVAPSFVYLQVRCPTLSTILRLTLKGEAGAELVAGLVELLGIEGTANAEGETAVDLGVVGEGCDAEVVNLSLL